MSQSGQKTDLLLKMSGVAPDIEVEQWPADVINGKDPQLEKAIEVALAGTGKESS